MITSHSPNTKKQILSLYKEAKVSFSNYFSDQEAKEIRRLIESTYSKREKTLDIFGFNIVVRKLDLALILLNELKLDKDSLIAAMMYDGIIPDAADNTIALPSEAAEMIESLRKVEQLYRKSPTVDSENFRNLLITFANDIRVILIILADRLSLMRMMNNYEDENARRKVAYECAYLYAPLAHRLGVYQIKTEMEDLSLKYTNREIYSQIASRLKSKKSERSEYVTNFIEPIKNKLLAEGLSCEIKGRPKSIHSIWNKIRKQEVTIEQIYDLFAIRIIIDTPYALEKSTCWHVYSIVTDMYQPNPKRLRDWLSIPKSNGYESLHTTVLGPDNKWVEVQIRTRRMDDIAERGLAAHWKYKGGEEKNNTDSFISKMRELLDGENNTVELIRDFKIQLAEEEVYVFTPKGDLHQLHKGATILDFAFQIHSSLGCRCTGAIINGKNVPLRHELNSGDQVEILTGSTQKPKLEWLSIVTSSKAKTKIRQVLKEHLHKEAEFGKEAFSRRMKNRKIEVDEALITVLIKKNGYKTLTDFFAAIANEALDLNNTIDLYQELAKRESESKEPGDSKSANNFVYQPQVEETNNKSDVLIIDNNVGGIDFKLSKCCKPVFGDKIFAFVSTNGVKVHREECPNAPQMISRFGYRIIEAKWSGMAKEFTISTIRVIGNDDISIISNITSIITKEKDVILRNINIDSNTGLFEGTISLSVKDASQLDSILKKIRTIKGVKQAYRN